MRTLLALAALAVTALPGCPVCGFEGEGDATYARGTETLMVCANGGFVRMTETELVEGRTALDTTTYATRGATGDTGALAFAGFALAADGTFASPELGDGWTQLALSDWDRDHAHVLCADLETRAWWPSTQTLPVATTFENGRDTLALAIDGTVTARRGNATDTGSYTISAGVVEVALSTGTFQATYAADGTLRVDGGGTYTRVQADASARDFR